METERWKLHITVVSQAGGWVWLCRGNYNCYHGTGYQYHDQFQIHPGPRWRFVIEPHWWQWRARMLDETMAHARQVLSDIENAQAMCEDAQEVERLVREL